MAQGVGVAIGAESGRGDAHSEPHLGTSLEKGGRRRVDLLGAFTFARNDTILTNSSE